MKKFISAAVAVLCASTSIADTSARKSFALESGWKFANSDIESAKTENFDDSKWESVNVPHDWAIDKPFDMNIDYQFVQVWQDGEKRRNLRTGRTGALPCFGVGWYRLPLDIPAAEKNRRVFLEFDGAMSNAQVFVNGQKVGERPYGYISFSFDITDFVKFGEKNLLAVRLDNKPLSSRWYSGAGLYRNVRLVFKSQTHIPYCGVYATTPKVSANSATVSVSTEVQNADGCAEVRNELFSADGKLAASSKNRAGEVASLEISNPKLWTPDSPCLYTLKTSIADKEGKVLDEVQTKIGVRSIKFSRANGFELNGKRTEIKGVCMHHDLGPIGAATNVSALRRQLNSLKEMGCNAIRTSHNPPSPELLDLCDEMGFLVENEAFDEWRHSKCDNGYHLLFDKWAERDLADFIRRDRNHPCVILWSIGNEVSDQKFEDGGQTAKYLVEIAHRTDPTRPITAGLDNLKGAFEKSKIAQQLDIAGINYRPHLYSEYAKKYPNMIFHGSETASTVSSRGAYHFPVERQKSPYHADYQVSSYDLETPPWAQPPDEEFAALDDNPTFFGEFVWTGWDYLGEPTPYNPGTPARSSYFGIVDLAGFNKDRFYLYQSRWNPSAKVLHILPHWNWEDRLGQNVPVMCYTSFPKVELFVNGKSAGVREKNPQSKNPLERYRMIWNNVVYSAGELRAVAYDADGKKAAESVVKTAGAPEKAVFTTKSKTFSANPKELIFVEIELVDKDGNRCPRASNFVFVEVKGAAKLRALCNGDATDQTKFSSNYMRFFNGRLMAVLEPTGDEGEAKISVYGMSLKPSEADLKISK